MIRGPNSLGRNADSNRSTCRVGELRYNELLRDLKRSNPHCQSNLTASPDVRNHGSGKRIRRRSCCLSAHLPRQCRPSKYFHRCRFYGSEAHRPILVLLQKYTRSLQEGHCMGLALPLCLGVSALGSHRRSIETVSRSLHQKRLSGISRSRRWNSNMQHSTHRPTYSRFGRIYTPLDYFDWEER